MDNQEGNKVQSPESLNPSKEPHINLESKSVSGAETNSEPVLLPQESSDSPRNIQVNPQAEENLEPRTDVENTSKILSEADKHLKDAQDMSDSNFIMIWFWDITPDKIAKAYTDVSSFFSINRTDV